MKGSQPIVWPRGVTRADLRALEPWDPRFGSHLGHECVSMYYILVSSLVGGKDVAAGRVPVPGVLSAMCNIKGVRS